MSDRIINKDFRQTKEIILPVSGLKVVIYNSMLVGEVADVYKEGESSLSNNLNVLIKVIKEWNLYESETAESASPINRENLNKLPIPDVEHLVKEMTSFAAEQKKSTQS